MGDPRRAAVVLLMNNPGWTPETDETQADAYHREVIKSLTFEDERGFTGLDDRFGDARGYRWWNSRLSHLVSRFGVERVRRSVAAVDWFPYASNQFKRPEFLLPSQEFTFQIVEDAVARGAVVIATRGLRMWVESIPELDGVVMSTKNPRSTHISPGNCPPGVFDALCDAIERGPSYSDIA